jgi:hypothetical protein
MYRYNQLAAPKIHAQGGLTPSPVITTNGSPADLSGLYDDMVAKPSPISSAPPEMLDESWPDNKALHDWYLDKQVFDGSQADKTNKELKAEYLDWIAKGAPPQGGVK